jgi:hypothetical protein
VDEEIEIKQPRKEQVPRSHLMQDFSRLFVTTRLVKPQTIPSEPRFHARFKEVVRSCMPIPKSGIDDAH